MSLSDERIVAIRREYWDAKLKMRDTARIVAIEYFTKSTHPLSDIEKSIGSTLNWANNDFEPVDPKDMIARYSIMNVIMQSVLEQMVEYGITTLEWIKNRLPEMEVKVHKRITEQRGQHESN